MRKARVFVVGLALLLIGGLATPIAVAQQDAPDGIQIFVVLDVSGSMSDFVFAEELPVEIVDIQNQISDLEAQAEAMENDPQILDLEEQIADLEADPAIPAAEAEFREAVAALDDWLADNGLGDQREISEAIQARLAELGCDEFIFANIVRAADVAEIEGWIDFACPDVDLTEEERQSIIDLASFIEDPEFQRLMEEQNAAFEVANGIREDLGINALETRVFTLLNDMGYYDIRDQARELEADLDDFARQQDFPIKLELAQLAAHTLLDLSRLDQVTGDVETSLGLAVFSTNAELRHEMTNDLDAIADEIDLLQPLERTNLGGGMTVALDELERLRDLEQPAAIILLSDGHSNEGMEIPEILDVIPRRADDLDVSICSAGFATTEEEVDADLLRGLAEQTNGEYLFLTRGEELTSFFLACRQGLVGTVVEQAAGLALTEPAEFGRIDVPENTCELSAAVAFVDLSPRVELVDPSGNPVPANARESGNLQLLTIADPAPGTWSAQVSTLHEDTLFSLVLSTEECPEPPPTATTTAAPTTSAATTTTVAAAPPPEEDGGSPALIIVLIVVLVGAGGAAVFFFLRRRRPAAEEE